MNTPTLVSLNDDELHVTLIALELLQQTRMRERVAANDPPYTVYQGEPLPPVDTPLGEMTHAGVLHLRLTEEAMRRELALRDAHRMAMEE